MVYNTRKTIWENLIICGIRNGKVAIDDNQLNRICMPNLNIGNSNLLHEWSRISQTKLQEVFSKTFICNSPVTQNKRFPFFLNFKGKSPLDLALENFDLQKFNLLLGKLITIQECFESSYIIDSVIVKAMQQNLDLKGLFQSKICTQIVNRDHFKHFEKFPEFHENSKTVSGLFRGTWAELMHSQSVIEDSLGPYFAQRASRDIDEAENFEVTNSERNKPIWYTIDALFVSLPQS